MKNKIVIICGATASGKSAYAMELAKKLDGVVLNADSMQVYKHIPILTAQPSGQDMEIVPHELYGFIDIGEGFSVGVWINLVLKKIIEVLDMGKTPILVGGTGLYLKSLIDGFAEIPAISKETKLYIESLTKDRATKELYEILKLQDNVLYNKLKENDRKRILRGLEVYYETKKPLTWWQENNHISFFDKSMFNVILISPSREVVYSNCNLRFYKMLDSGAFDEVRYLLENYPYSKYPEAIGLKEIISYLKGDVELEVAIAKAQQLTRNYAKRQMTWFRHQLQYDQIIEEL